MLCSIQSFYSPLVVSTHLLVLSPYCIIRHNPEQKQDTDLWKKKSMRKNIFSFRSSIHSANAIPGTGAAGTVTTVGSTVMFV